jgi:hypothetical protein
MLEADAVKGKGGRPRKKVGRQSADTEEQDDAEAVGEENEHKDE